ncbi:MAG: DUF3857 and transglutaminase domain-containing protein [Hyphomicrobiales bacterium]
MQRLIIAVALSICLAFSEGSGSLASAKDNVQTVWHDDFHVNADMTYRQIETLDRVVTREKDIGRIGRYDFTFDPAYQTFKVVEAFVEQKGGERTMVAPDSMLVRPSQATRSAPGFTSTKTATLLFPKVGVGTKVHIRTEIITFKPFSTGFNLSLYAGLFEPTDCYLSIDAPKSLHLTVGQTKGFRNNRFRISDWIEGERRHIEAQAHLRDVSGAERHMPAYGDLSPHLIVSTLSSYQDLARIYNRLLAGKVTLTPEIRMLADKVSAGKTGGAAAQALYDWVAGNIRYVALWLNAEANWIPHDAATVLKNGFGDCKDHVVLLQALLSAKGIASEAVLVDWSNRRRDWPVASASAFNHMMIYLPEYKLYANPTDGTAPFGVLTYSLRDKLVVHLGPHFRVAHTPSMKPDDAYFTTRGALAIVADGSVSGTAKADMSPMLEPYWRRRLSDADDRQRAMKSALSSLPHVGSGYLETSNVQDLDTPFTLTMKWLAPHALQLDAAGFILPQLPDFTPQSSPQSYLAGYKDGKQRRYPVALWPKKLHWHFTVTPPPGRVFQTLPPTVRVGRNGSFYAATYKIENGVLVVDRSLVIATSEVKAAEYGEVVAMARAMMNDFGTIISLKTADEHL